jgi:hypothetical protein
MWIFWNVKFHAIFVEHRDMVWISGSRKQYLQSDGLESVIILSLVDAVSITESITMEPPRICSRIFLDIMQSQADRQSVGWTTYLEIC